MASDVLLSPVVTWRLCPRKLTRRRFFWESPCIVYTFISAQHCLRATIQHFLSFSVFLPLLPSASLCWENCLHQGGLFGAMRDWKPSTMVSIASAKLDERLIWSPIRRLPCVGGLWGIESSQQTRSPVGRVSGEVVTPTRKIYAENEVALECEGLWDPDSLPFPSDMPPMHRMPSTCTHVYSTIRE